MPISSYVKNMLCFFFLAQSQVIYYPRAGFGNQLMGYVSAEMLAERMNTTVCLPQDSHEKLKCTGITGRFCSLPTCTKSSPTIIYPEAWDKCIPQKRNAMISLMCSKPAPTIAVSSCQYWGWLLYRNPYLRFGMGFNEILKKVIAPRNIQPPVHMCVHVRYDITDTWARAVKEWLNGKRFLVHSMSMHARHVLNKIGGRSNTFESATLAGGNSVNFSADFWSLTRCSNIIASHPRSTYVLTAANWGDAKLWHVIKSKVVRASKLIVGDMLHPDICNIKEATCQDRMT